MNSPSGPSHASRAASEGWILDMESPQPYLMAVYGSTRMPKYEFLPSRVSLRIRLDNSHLIA